MLFSTSAAPRTNGKSSGSARTAGAIEKNGREFSLSLTPLPGEGIIEIFTRLASALKETDSTPAHLIVFGSVAANAAGTEAMRRIFGPVDFPVTWIDGASCHDHPIAALQALSFSGAVRRIEMNGRVVGSVFEHSAARHCILGGLGPLKNVSTRADQTKQTLEHLQTALARAGFSLADVVRTWFFLEDILSWYDDFNRARTEIYSRAKFQSGSLPASTGVGAKNPSRAALAAAAWAMQPLDNSVCVREIASPLQCPAPAYGSSFSRAVELSSAAGSQILISGTASIAPGGETLWRDDARRQLALTMDVVEAILRSRGLGFSDVTRATAYFKHRADARLLSEWQAMRGLESLPVAPVECAICRDDLLLELEADAWRVAGNE